MGKLFKHLMLIRKSIKTSKLLRDYQSYVIEKEKSFIVDIQEAISEEELSMIEQKAKKELFDEGITRTYASILFRIGEKYLFLTGKTYKIPILIVYGGVIRHLSDIDTDNYESVLIHFALLKKVYERDNNKKLKVPVLKANSTVALVREI